MSEPVATEQCHRRDVRGRRCALIAGHGIAFHGYIRGDVIDGHLYSTGEDLSGEIRAQAVRDRLAAAEQRAEAAEAERDRMRAVIDAASAWSKAWYDAQFDPISAQNDPEDKTSAALYAALDAYRAGQPATSEAERIAATLVCSTCNDTHRMTLGDREVPCTRCPVPCETCRSRPVGAGPGAYCAGTPCGCPCHRAGAWRKP